MVPGSGIEPLTQGFSAEQLFIKFIEIEKICGIIYLITIKHIIVIVIPINSLNL